MSNVVQYQMPKMLADKGLTQEKYGALKAALYQDASDGAIGVVLDICKARNLDIMKKPYHIVSYGGKEQFLPSVDLLRTIAMRTGRYAGQDKVIFGPDEEREFTLIKGGYNGAPSTNEKFKLTFPTYAEVTVYRVVAGQKCAFTAVAYWLEAYAKANRQSTAPNDMWRTRTRGQLEKCAEAAALRKAFPEETGEEQTVEEIIGHDDDGVVLDTVAAAPAENGQDRIAKVLDAEIIEEPETDEEMDAAIEDMRGYLRLRLNLAAVTYMSVGQLDDEIRGYRDNGTMDAYAKKFPENYQLLLSKIDNKRKQLEDQVPLTDDIPL